MVYQIAWDQGAKWALPAANNTSSPVWKTPVQVWVGAVCRARAGCIQKSWVQKTGTHVGVPNIRNKKTRVGVFRKVRSKVYRGYSICSVNTLRVQKSSVMFGTNSITVPNASIRSVRNTCTRHFDKFGATSIPVPDTSVSSVRPQYRYPTLR